LYFFTDFVHIVYSTEDDLV